MGDAERPSAVHDLWHYIRPYRRLMLLGGLLGLVGNAVALALPLAARSVIDAVGGGGAFDIGPLAVLTALVFLGGVLAAGGAYALERMAAEVVHGVRTRMIVHALRLRVGSVSRPGDLISRVTADTTLLSRAASRSVVDAVNGTLMLVGAIVLMALLDLVLLGVTLLVLTVILAVGMLAMPRIARAQERTQAAVGDVGSGLERVLGAFRTVKASGAEDLENARLGAATDRARDHMVTTAKWTALARVAAGLATQLAFLSVLGVGGVRVAMGELGVSSLIAFLLYLFSLSQPIGVLVQAVTDLQAGLAAVRRVRAVEHLTPEDEGGTRVQSCTGPASVEFTDVRFGYEDGTPVLDGVSFAAGAGETVALVGESGGGKTTVFSLLERFHDVDAGSVLLDGMRVADWSLRELRSQIGYVEQDAPVLEGTLRENLVYSARDVSDEELRSMLDRTRLTEVVDRMPLGVDTPVGHRGVTLSGGQRQRVAIARALLRRPRLLLLDEATSQLDADNERALRETVSDVARTTTVILIAHRLSTVVDADRIVVLDRGRVRATGTHSELVARDALYARFSDAQMLVG